jgi:hypothetical protein
MNHIKRTALVAQLKSQIRNYSMALSMAVLVIAGCTRAAATKAHVRAMKPAPKSVPAGVRVLRSSETDSVTPRVWELTALAPRKGPSVVS